jgi:translocation and assembly module TamB
VVGLSTNIHFTDLQGLETAPGQVATVASINPGIEVTNGTIRYQLLPDQLVKIERGEWPFMGGRLILQETILNFGAPTAKRLTFQVEGLNAKTFLDTLGFEGIEITGVFDGVLPMIFDEEGGRIVGGRLDSRQPGGQFRYTGTKPNAGLAAGLAFDLLSDIRYRSMIIRLDGDLAGEFATRISIDQITLANRGGFLAGLVRGAFRNVPLKVNLNVQGPFRALIQMAKGMKDPTQVIAPVMPFPVDSPALDVVVVRNQKDEEQDPETPTNVIERTPNPQAEGETK